jgi:ankyrin repeat protein
MTLYRTILTILFVCCIFLKDASADTQKKLTLPYTCDPANREAIYELLKNKPEYINAFDKIGRSPLFYTITLGDEDMAIELINKGADIYQLNLRSPGQTALHIAAQFNRIKVVDRLLQTGLPINQKTLNEYGVTPLHDAALEGHSTMVQYLLDHGADVNIISNDGWTALDDAYGRGHNEIIKILEVHGAKRSK